MSSELLIPCHGGRDERRCRICHEPRASPETGPFSSPCLCDGSVRWVHEICLDRWRFALASDAARCELCGFVYRYDLQHVSHCDACTRVLRRAFPAILTLGLIFVAFALATSSAWVGLLSVGSLLGAQAVVDVFRFVILSCRLPARSDAAPYGGAPLSAVAASALIVFARWSDGASQDLAKDLRRTVELEERVLWERRAAMENVVAARANGLQDPDAETDPGGDARALAFCVAACCCTCAIVALGVPPLIVILVPYLVGHCLQGAITTLAAVGSVYVVLVVAFLTFVQLRCPTFTAKRGAIGLATVRSISEEERREACR
mmetsp:Transcript_88208/g.248247  ORF Transcript_88208/g.248247 Transcript_88208/m.248247 type:complete len:319 (+) Transcript_88208:113-1069(+)